MAQYPHPRNPLIRLVGRIWASPVTLIGLVLGGLGLVTGGSVRAVEGVLEFHGGWVTTLLRAPFVRAYAMTLGNVILGVDAEQLDRWRMHEHGHVRQAELWGPLFLPAYGVASVAAWLRGGHYYRDNWFEIDAAGRPNA
ncbi:MAG: hypothetical protein ACOYON_02675 [Fimbriimonas sp.]